VPPVDPAIDAAPSAVIVADADGRVLHFNPAAEATFGFSRTDAVGRTVAELVVPERLRDIDRARLSAVASGSPPRILGRRHRVPALRADGSEFLAEMVVTRTREAPAQFTAWIEDISDQEEARRRTAFAADVEEVGQTGSWERNLATREIFWSDNVFRLLGLEPGAITPSAEYVIERTHPDDRELLEGVSNAIASRGALPASLHYRVVLPARGVRHFLTTIATITESGDDSQRVVGTVRDITEQRSAEREIAAHFAVSEALDVWESLEQGGRLLLRNLAQAMEFEAGTLWVVDGDLLAARAFWHAGSSDFAEFESVTRGLRRAKGVGLAGRVWESRRPISIDNVQEQPDFERQANFARRQAAVHAGLRGAVSLPALNRDEVLAVVDLYSREEREPTDRLMRSLTGIGYELGHFLGRRRGELTAPALTRRELQILQLAAQGHSGRQIAERLVVSPATVKTHFTNAYKKLAASDRASAVATALRLGLIK
jgi:PAS domain S-box-containing protein